jgi:hypothetical protein
MCFFTIERDTPRRVPISSSVQPSRQCSSKLAWVLGASCCRAPSISDSVVAVDTDQPQEDLLRQIRDVGRVSQARRQIPAQLPAVARGQVGYERFIRVAAQ